MKRLFTIVCCITGCCEIKHLFIIILRIIIIILPVVPLFDLMDFGLGTTFFIFATPLKIDQFITFTSVKSTKIWSLGDKCMMLYENRYIQNLSKIHLLLMVTCRRVASNDFVVVRLWFTAIK